MALTSRQLRRTTMLVGAFLMLSGAARAPQTPAVIAPTCFGHSVTLFVPAGGALYRGSDDPDVIEGTSGDDIIYGQKGDDIICGRGGNDTIRGQLGDDIIYGEGGNDVLYGGGGGDWLYGHDGNDTLSGNDGDDVLYAHGGDDVLQCGNGGADFADGGVEVAPNDVLLAGHGCEFVVNVP